MCSGDTLTSSVCHAPCFKRRVKFHITRVGGQGTPKSDASTNRAIPPVVPKLLGWNPRLLPTVRSVTSLEAEWSVVVVVPDRSADIADTSGQRCHDIDVNDRGSGGVR
jgi:hypothetical protein